MKAIVLMGLPLAGKTTWIQQNVDSEIYKIVSADALKERHPDYDPENAEALHEWSVQRAEEFMNHYSKNYNIVMDAGSINNSYTKRIILMLKSKGYFVQLVHIKTPYYICLKRNKERIRKVPEEAILKKAAKENLQFNTLIPLVNNYQVVEYYTNKNLFIDMDGIIAALSTLPIINGEIDFVNTKVHLYLKPVKVVIDKLLDLQNKGYNLYILSAIPNSFSYNEKNEWLDKYFDIPKENRFFVNQGRHKAEMLENISEYLQIEKKDITMIDDIHDTLYAVQKREMNCMHISEFLTHEFKPLK
jgi:predicted kinase